MNNSAVTTRVLIAGCGDVGCALATLLADQGYSVYGLRRNTTMIPSSVSPISADLNDPLSLQQLPLVDILIYCAAPSRARGDNYQQTYLNGFKNLLQALPQPPSHCIFTSSTSVYHQAEHQWINESSPAIPLTDRGKTMLAAERQVQLLAERSTIVRFAGIYGPGREHLLNQVKDGKAAPKEPVLYSNRIHRDDCAELLAFLINKVRAGKTIEPLYVAADCLPCPISEVTDWLCDQTNSPVSKVLAPRATPSKRCDNRAILKLGYTFKHPDFRSGYKQILQISDAD